VLKVLKDILVPKAQQAAKDQRAAKDLQAQLAAKEVKDSKEYLINTRQVAQPRLPLQQVQPSLESIPTFPGQQEWTALLQPMHQTSAMVQ